MSKQIWGGITIWGIFVTCFGVGAMSPTSVVLHTIVHAAPDQEVIFLLTGGIVTCLIGFIGLIGLMSGLQDLTDNPVPQCATSCIDSVSISDLSPVVTSGK